MQRYHQATRRNTEHPATPRDADPRDRWATAILKDRALGNAARLTAWALREHANRDGETTVGVARLAAELGKHPRRVEADLERLTRAGYLERVAGAGRVGRGGWTSRTVLKVPTATVGTLNHKAPTPPDESPDAMRREAPTHTVGQTLLNPLTPAVAGPGSEAGTAPAAPILGGLAGERLGPRPVRDEVLARLRAVLGSPAKRAAAREPFAPRADTDHPDASCAI